MDSGWDWGDFLRQGRFDSDLGGVLSSRAFRSFLGKDRLRFGALAKGCGTSLKEKDSRLLPMKRWFVVFVVVVLLVLSLWFSSRDIIDRQRQEVGESGETVVVDTTGPGAGQAAGIAVAEPSDFMSAHKMQSLVFQFEAGTIELVSIKELAGRVKRAPFSQAPDRLEFELKDGTGEVVYAGSIDHPGIRHFEAAPSSEEESWERIKVVSEDSSEVHVRIPNESMGSSITWSEVRSPLAERRVIATVNLR